MARYSKVRENIDNGDGTWRDLAQFFTDDAVFIDPAWGRVEGLDEMKATVFGDAMVGLEDWKFPIEFYAIDGDNVVVKWKQILPGARDDGRPWRAVGRVDAHLRGRRQVPLRGRPAQHGARLRGHARERVPGARGRDAAQASRTATSPDPEILVSATIGDRMARFCRRNLRSCRHRRELLAESEHVGEEVADLEDSLAGGRGSSTGRCAARDRRARPSGSASTPARRQRGGPSTARRASC